MGPMTMFKDFFQGESLFKGKLPMPKTPAPKSMFFEFMPADSMFHEYYLFMEGWIRVIWAQLSGHNKPIKRWC